MAEQNVAVRFIVKGSRSLGTAIRKAISGFGQLKNIARNTAFRIAALGGAITGLVEATARRAGDIEGITDSFVGLAKASDVTSDVLLQKLEGALDGTVSKMDMMRLANQAILLGLPATSDDMAELADTAQRLGRAMGVGPVKAFQDLVQGIGRQSRLILDNLGIVVKAQFAYDNFAKSKRKNVEVLTDLEKKQAFYEETLRVAKARLKDIGDENLTFNDILSKVIATFINMRDEVVAMIAESGALDGILKQVEDQFKAWMQVIRDNKDTIKQVIVDAANGIARFANIMFELAPVIIDVITWVVANADTILKVISVLGGFAGGAATGGAFGGPIGALIGGVLGGGAALLGYNQLEQAAASGPSNTNITVNATGGDNGIGEFLAKNQLESIEFRARGGQSQLLEASGFAEKN